MTQDWFWNLVAKKLSGEATPEELEELAQLIRRYPFLADTAEKMHQFWYASTNDPETSGAEQAYEKLTTKLEEQGAFVQQAEDISPAIKPYASTPKPFYKKRKRMVGAFSVLFLLVMGGVLWKEFNVHGTQMAKGNNPETIKFIEVATKPGSKTRLVLPDSSIVWLNSGSKLNYSAHFGDTERTVMLEGEAFFDVKKSRVPFVIHAGKVNIRVLGTAFNVRNYPEEKKVETSLIRGKVEVTIENRPETKYALSPNEKLVLNTNENSPSLKNKKDTAPFSVLSPLHYLDSLTTAETSWVENKVVFDDESFEEIAKKMERWYGVRIIFRSEKLKKERMHGTISNESIWQALEHLKFSTPFHYQSGKNNEIILTY